MIKKHQVQPANSNDLKRTYTVKEISDILGIPLRSAYDYCREGTAFKVVRLGKHIRVVKESFDEWFNA